MNLTIIEQESLLVIASLIQKSSDLWKDIHEGRRQMTELEDRTDLLLVRIGEIELD